MINRRKFLEHTVRSIALIGAGNLLQSFEADGFTLPSKREVLLRFALASDGHYGQPKTDFSGNHDRMTAWLNNEKKRRGLDHVFVNGDIIHDDPTLLAAAKAACDKLKVPYSVSHGNHDRVEESHWEKTWGTPWHYELKKGDVAFLVLNTANIKGDYICPDLDWTKRKLDEHKTKKHLFIVMHITPVKWTDHGIDCPELVALFSSQANLKAVFHGHDHIEDNGKEKNGKHYFFDGHVGGNWGTPYHGYRVVEVLRNGTILTYQVNPAQKEPVNHLLYST